MDKWLTVKELADYLGISKETIYRRLKNKSIPAYRVGKGWRFKASEIDEHVREGKFTDEWADKELY